MVPKKTVVFEIPYHVGIFFVFKQTNSKHCSIHTTIDLKQYLLPPTFLPQWVVNFQPPCYLLTLLKHVYFDAFLLRYI